MHISWFDLWQLGGGAWQQRPTEFLLWANGSREGRGWKQGRHRVDACDPRLHLFSIPTRTHQIHVNNNKNKNQTARNRRALELNISFIIFSSLLAIKYKSLKTDVEGALWLVQRWPKWLEYKYFQQLKMALSHLFISFAVMFK